MKKTLNLLSIEFAVYILAHCSFDERYENVSIFALLIILLNTGGEWFSPSEYALNECIKYLWYNECILYSFYIGVSDYMILIWSIF